MGYDLLIKRQVKKAFGLAKDLAVEATLLRKTSNFNFATKIVDQSADTALVVKGFPASKEWIDRNSATAVLRYGFTVQSADIADITMFDRLVIGGITWNIQTPAKNNGYTMTIGLYRSATNG